MQMRSPATTVALVLTAACSGVGVAPRTESLSTPRLAPTVTSRFCIRETAGVGQTLTGTIAATDCDDSAGYYETYLVKVSTPREVTFAVDSKFDSFLALIEVTSFSDIDYSGNLLAHDDDSNGRNDAKLTMPLQPGVDYALLVSGLNHTDTGAYTLTIR